MTMYFYFFVLDRMILVAHVPRDFEDTASDCTVSRREGRHRGPMKFTMLVPR
jgi:hypothetical protein